jgi:hypothetical protein
MYDLDNYAAVRRFVFIEGHSQREAARVFFSFTAAARTISRHFTHSARVPEKRLEKSAHFSGILTVPYPAGRF